MIGCGRSGTNLLFEMIRASGAFNPSKNIEDRDIFSFRELPKSYLTKIAIERLDDFDLIERYMEKFGGLSPLRLIFSVRHPYDTLMSKIFRGQPKGKGGDNQGQGYMSDASPQAACEMIRKNWELWQVMATKYPDRVMIVKMENILTYPVQTAGIISHHFFNFSMTNEMLSPWKYNTNAFQVRRYGKNKANQIDVWKNRNAYNGFFHNFDLAKYNEYFYDIAKYFNYELL